MSKTRAIAPLSNMSSTSWTSSASRKNRRRPFPEVWQALEDKEDETQEEEIKQRVHASREATTRQHHHHQQHQQRDDDDADDNASDDEYANEVKEEDDEDDEEQKGDREASRPSDSSSLALISGGSGGGDSSRSHRPTKRHRPRRRFSHIKSDILGSKTLVRRAQEEARLRSSRSSASKWQRLLEGVCGGAGTLGTLASVGLMARKTTGEQEMREAGGCGGGLGGENALAGTRDRNRLRYRISICTLTHSFTPIFVLFISKVPQRRLWLCRLLPPSPLSGVGPCVDEGRRRNDA